MARDITWTGFVGLKGFRMLHQALANSTDLTTWAGRVESRSTLPLLVRRLIHATTNKIIRVGFPAGDAVQFPGWDGLVEAVLGNAFVPAGLSAWEMGTDSNIKRKADSDYAKRSANPLGVDPATSTFVFVTPRRWPGKEQWVNARKAEGVWKDIRAYDADSLEEWLDLAPSVHIWLSNLLGKMPCGASDLSSVWLDWSECTIPTLTPTMVLAGRKDIHDSIVAWLGGTARSLSIRAEAKDESLAIFSATIMELPPEVKVAHLSSALVVESVDAWNQLVRTAAPLLLIPTFDDAEAIIRAQRAGHRVVVGLSNVDVSSPETLQVPPLDVAAIQKELILTGIPDDRAQELASLARRSVTSFRRQLARNPEFQVPAWAQPGEAPKLVPFLFAGAWNGTVEKDRSVIESLSAKPYMENAASLARWSVVSDPPVRSVGDTWYLVSKDDAWRLLFRYITPDLLLALQKVVLGEFGAIDTRFDLLPDERWSAPKSPGISGHLRDGLAETLIILSIRDDVFGGTSGREFVNNCVWKLFQQANADWRLWASLPLRLLAEAAPEVFLEAVDEGLQGPDPVVMKLFETGGDPLFSTSPHTNLLWALEIVAWSPEYLGQAAQLLARLSRLDPGGTTTNRPIRSLEQIFLFWHEQTTASFEQRVEVLERLSTSEPKVAWTLYCELLPTGHTIGHQNPTPRWRDWAPQVRPTGYSRQEYYNGTCAIVRLMLALAGKDASRWKDLVEHLSDLPSDQRDVVVQALKGIDVGGLDDPSLAVIWNSLRRLISKHRSYADAGWALPAEVLNDLESVYRRFEPHDTLLQYAWLFDGNPDLLEGREQDWEEHARIVQVRRQEALSTIACTGGKEAIFRLATDTASPWDVGTTLGINDLLDRSAEDELLQTYLGSDDANCDLMARGFIYGRVQKQGETWYREAVARLWQNLTPRQQAHFLLQLPENENTFDLAETTPETEEEYWQVCGGRFVEPAVYERSVRQLFKHRRPFTAIERLDFMSKDPKPSNRFIVEAMQLLAAEQEPREKPSHMFTFHLTKLFSKIEKAADVTEAELASLEWALLPALVSFNHDRSPKTLHRWLNKNPGFFVELVSLVYKAEQEEDRELELDSDAVARAENAYQLLNSWDIVPGQSETADDIDGDYLLDWTRQARDMLAKAKRLTVGDITIGELLANAPAGDDSIWPHRAVRNVIETLQSPAIDRGFRTGIFNSRGIYTKSLNEGGDQERALAEKYRGFADALRGTAPRTAASLRRVADAYRGDARREDVEAELRVELGI